MAQLMLIGILIYMISIEKIEDAIRQLPPTELSLFREWFAKFDADKWDEQFESDALSGRLDSLAKEAIAELRAGRCTDL